MVCLSLRLSVHHSICPSSGVQTRTHISSGPGRSSVARLPVHGGVEVNCSAVAAAAAAAAVRPIDRARERGEGSRGRCSPTHLIRRRRRFSGPPQPRSGPFPPNAADTATHPPTRAYHDQRGGVVVYTACTRRNS